MQNWVLPACGGLLLNVGQRVLYDVRNTGGFIVDVSSLVVTDLAYRFVPGGVLTAAQYARNGAGAMSQNARNGADAMSQRVSSVVVPLVGTLIDLSPWIGQGLVVGGTAGGLIWYGNNLLEVTDSSNTGATCPIEPPLPFLPFLQPAPALTPAPASQSPAPAPFLENLRKMTLLEMVENNALYAVDNLMKAPRRTGEGLQAAEKTLGQGGGVTLWLLERMNWIPKKFAELNETLKWLHQKAEEPWMAPETKSGVLTGTGLHILEAFSLISTGFGAGEAVRKTGDYVKNKLDFFEDKVGATFIDWSAMTFLGYELYKASGSALLNYSPITGNYRPELFNCASLAFLTAIGGSLLSRVGRVCNGFQGIGWSNLLSLRPTLSEKHPITNLHVGIALGTIFGWHTVKKAGARFQKNVKEKLHIDLKEPVNRAIWALGAVGTSLLGYSLFYKGLQRWVETPPLVPTPDTIAGLFTGRTVLIAGANLLSPLCSHLSGVGGAAVGINDYLRPHNTNNPWLLAAGAICAERAFQLFRTHPKVIKKTNQAIQAVSNRCDAIWKGTKKMANGWIKTEYKKPVEPVIKAKTRTDLIGWSLPTSAAV
ncbi:MAG: hypothetical protein KDK40_04020 [Chlamydiia bacterium]|nr:hypothetical protein [Chlamydiia bacterium]